MYIVFLCWSSDLKQKFQNWKIWINSWTEKIKKNRASKKNEQTIIFVVECWLQETHVDCGSSIYANEKYFAHRHKSTVFMFIVALSRQVIIYSHAHKTHFIKRVLTVLHIVCVCGFLLYFHLHTSTNQQSIEKYRESSMKLIC